MLSSSAAVASSPLPEQSAMSPAPTSTTDALVATRVRADEPFWPSLVAVIVADPTAAPLTSPLGLTVATDVLPLAHVTVRPVSGLPPASFGVAVSCTVDPTCAVAEEGATVTETTGTCTTVMADVPLCPSLVAVIVAGPPPPPPPSPPRAPPATPAVPLTPAHAP